MLVSRGDTVRPNILGVTVFSAILLSEIIFGAALESTKSLTRSTEKITMSSQTPKIDPAENVPPPATGAEFAKECYAFIHNFTFSAIVSHNMNQSQASQWHVGRDKDTFLNLAGNLTQTIMKLVEQMDQIGAMFSVHKEVPTEMYDAPSSAETCEKTEEDGDSSTVTLWLLLIILALVLYIGFLTYQIKTKYRNSGSGILIEDR